MNFLTSVRRSVLAALAGGFIALTPAGFAQGRATAGHRLLELQARLVNDSKGKNWRAYLADAGRLAAFLNQSPTSQLEVARGHLHLGETAQALAETRGVLDLGVDNAVLASPLFEPINKVIEPQRLNNRGPIALAHISIEMKDGPRLSEDIDFDSKSGRFFVTSILDKAIVSVGEDNSRNFATAPDGWPLLALKLDPTRRRLWATEVALDTFKIVPRDAWGRSAVLEYDLDDGRLLARIDAPRTSLGDMALTPDGVPIVSDGDGGGVYIVKDGALRRIDRGDFISPQTIAFCDDPDVAFMPDYVRGLARLDVKTGVVRWFDGVKHALDGIDGLYCRGRTLIAVQNGAAPQRLIAFQLDATKTRIVSEQVLERAAPGRGDMTHGVWVGADFYFIANAGWAALNDNGEAKTGVATSPAIIARVSANTQSVGPIG